MPSRKELGTLSDYGRYNPGIDPIFENVASDNYWSSTTYAGTSSSAWVVYFGYGYQYYYGKSTNLYVRCVRAGE